MDDVRKNPNSLFVFADNYSKIGWKGQACIRGEPNSFGLPTQRKIGFSHDAYLSDSEFTENVAKFEEAINKFNYEFIYFPENGFGTGLAKLSEKAPLTFEYVTTRIKELMLTLN